MSKDKNKIILFIIGICLWYLLLILFNPNIQAQANARNNLSITKYSSVNDNARNTPVPETQNPEIKSPNHKNNKTIVINQTIPSPLNQKIRDLIIGLGILAVIIVLFGLWLNRKNLRNNS